MTGGDIDGLVQQVFAILVALHAPIIRLTKVYGLIVTIRSLNEHRPPH